MYAYGSSPLSFADWIKLMTAAARLPVRIDPANSQSCRPIAMGLHPSCPAIRQLDRIVIDAQP